MMGKKVVITGGNSGIGLEMVRMLKSGNEVFAVDVETDALEEIEGIHVFECDISSKEGVDGVFEAAVGAMGGIDVFCANAGYAHFGIMDTDWGKAERIFLTNAVSPIYSYQKFRDHLGDREGSFALTCSGMGKMGMPGYSLYSSTKFALDGFQESVRFENPANLSLTVCYPVAVDTAFFDEFGDVEKPYPVQQPDFVARRFIKAIDKGRRKVYTSSLFRFALVLFTLLPFTRRWYWKSKKRKLDEYLEDTGREA